LLATFLFACAQNEVGAHLGKPFGHLPSKPNRTSGDDRYAPREVKQIPYFHCLRHFSQHPRASRTLVAT
jgi:hypothetical protein